MLLAFLKMTIYSKILSSVGVTNIVENIKIYLVYFMKYIPLIVFIIGLHVVDILRKYNISLTDNIIVVIVATLNIVLFLVALYNMPKVSLIDVIILREPDLTINEAVKKSKKYLKVDRKLFKDVDNYNLLYIIELIVTGGLSAFYTEPMRILLKNEYYEYVINNQNI